MTLKKLLQKLFLHHNAQLAKENHLFKFSTTCVIPIRSKNDQVLKVKAVNNQEPWLGVWNVEGAKEYHPCIICNKLVEAGRSQGDYDDGYLCSKECKQKEHHKKQEEAEKEAKKECCFCKTGCHGGGEDLNCITCKEYNKIKKKRNEEEQPQSIWKDGLEEPEEECQIIMEGEISIEDSLANTPYYRNRNKWCYLTDFLNDIEALKERVKKLEEK